MWLCGSGPATRMPRPGRSGARTRSLWATSSLAAADADRRARREPRSMTMADVVWRRIEVVAHPAGSAAWPGSVSILLLLAIAAICVLFLWPEVRRSDGGTDDSDEGGSGGDDWGGGPTPPCPPPDTDPAWWPEFEREFAAYVNGDRAPAGVLLAAEI